MKSATQDMNLTLLEQEPIHLYNRLQPYGILLVLEEPDLRILQVSSNAQELLGIPLENIINQTLESIFDAFQVGYIKEGLKDNNFDFINPILLNFTLSIIILYFFTNYQLIYKRVSLVLSH